MYLGVLTDVLAHAIFEWEDLAPQVSVSKHWHFVCVCARVCEYDSQRCKLYRSFVVCVIFETVVHPLGKERDRQKL